MATLSGLKRTLMVTRDLHSILFMKFSKKRRSITFRNGSTLRLTWPEFRLLRDNYKLLKENALEQVNEGLFKIKTDKLDFTGSLLNICILAGFNLDFAVQQMGANLFKIKNDKLELMGSFAMLGSIWEIEQGDYDCDCRGKVVLDVGGFEGESTAFFWIMGAKKVIIYEPVRAHHEFIRKNVSLNHINAEIHEEGIGNGDGTQIIDYEDMGTCFGDGKGHHQMEIKIRDVASVIEESDAKVAKFDCEGAEESLVHVSSEILRRIEFYIIEVHTPEIRRAIIKKFNESGFSLVKETAKNTQRSVISLKLNLSVQ